MINKFALIILLIVSIGLLTGCNTFHGIGKDIESLGKAFQKGSGQAEENK
ncbi:MAG: entericidin A/B family lipoprotein [Candidatus Hodarchaeales archaeon]|jgi:predicted small secreted protein